MKSLLLLALASGMTYASIDQAPPGFSYENGKTVFVDFKSADYEITYDVDSKQVEVESTVRLTSLKNGYPIFDLIPEPSEMTLDGVAVESEAIPDPDNQTTMRVIKKKVGAGDHVLHIRHKISTNIVWGEERVASGFWMSDLNDRRYLEQYLPANLEFDQYQMTIHAKINGATVPHVIKSNGDVQELGDNEFEVSFPSYFSTSSMYFHLFPSDSFANTAQFYYKSIDGRMIPVDIYTIYDATEFADQTKTILAELENDYGPFPHNKLVIYGNAPSGGMEHSGATITSLSALGHELFHSYHARGLMPANGNAGWMDEAIARFRDNKYPLTAKLTFESTRLAGHSIWSRMTDRMAYKEGSAFLSWIAHRMNDKGLSFKRFLRDYFEKYKYTTVTTELFKEEVSSASGMDLSADFDKYIYGRSMSLNLKKMMSLRPAEEDEYHPNFTKEQLLNLTWL